MGSIYEQLIDLLANGANSLHLLITDRLQLTDNSKFYPSLLAWDKILISANPC